MGVCSSKSSASPADKKGVNKLPAAGEAGKRPSNAAAAPSTKPAQDPNQLRFVPAKDDAHITELIGEKAPVEISVAPTESTDKTPPPLFTRPLSDNAPVLPPDGARATSTARVEEVVIPSTKPSGADDENGAVIRRAPPPPPTTTDDPQPPAETPVARKAQWEEVRARLPRKKTPEDKARRLELFEQFDADKSGALTYEEVHKGCIDILHLDHFTPHLYDITRRAFNEAKVLGTEDRGAGSKDKVKFLEFRLMLCYIYDYFELTVLFDEIDKNGSLMIDKDEFIEKAAPMLTRWGVPVTDAEATFNRIDVNESGIITFEEFATWATDQKSEIVGDPDAGVEAAASAPPAKEEKKPRAAEVDAKASAHPPSPPPPAVDPAAAPTKEEKTATAHDGARSVPVDASPVPHPSGLDASAAASVQDEPSATARQTEWQRIRALLPCEKTPADKQRRIDLFEQFDKDESSALTYDEVYKACVNVLHLNRFTSRLRDITKRAFNTAKSMGNKERDEGDEDKVKFLEFRLMLCYIYDYFELTVLFDAIDTDGSRMLDEKEFVEKAAPMLESWGVTVGDAAAKFHAIANNNSGHITFDEFATWATEQKVTAGGDPDAVPPQSDEEAAPAPEPEVEPIVFTDESEMEKDEVVQIDENDENDEEDEGPTGALDPRRVYGFDGDSTGLGAGAKEEGAMALDDHEDLDENSSDDGSAGERMSAKTATLPPPPPEADVKPVVPVVVRATKEKEFEMGSDVEAKPDMIKEASAPRAVSLQAAKHPVEEEASKPAAVAAEPKASHVDPMVDVKPFVPVVVRATQEREFEMGSDAEAKPDMIKEASAPRAVSLQAAKHPVEEEVSKPAAVAAEPKASHVDPMVDVKPFVPVVVRATKEREFEMGSDAEAKPDMIKEASAPRAVSLEAAGHPVAEDAAATTTTASVIQQNIIDDLFADGPAPVRPDPPAPRRLPPPMPSPAERAESPEDDEHVPHADANKDAEDNEPVEVVATPPPARRAPPPMFSPPLPDADSDAENSISKDVDAFYGRGTEADPVPQAPAVDSKKSGHGAGNEL